MIFDVEVVLRESNHAVTERIVIPTLTEHAARAWTDVDVEQILKEILLAIDRVRNPQTNDRYVALRSFSWIVEPAAEGGVVIAIEISSGAAVAGPFAIDQATLDRIIARVVAAATPVRPVVH